MTEAYEITYFRIYRHVSEAHMLVRLYLLLFSCLQTVLVEMACIDEYNYINGQKGETTSSVYKMLLNLCIMYISTLEGFCLKSHFILTTLLKGTNTLLSSVVHYTISTLC